MSTIFLGLLGDPNDAKVCSALTAACERRPRRSRLASAAAGYSASRKVAITARWSDTTSGRVR